MSLSKLQQGIDIEQQQQVIRTTISTNKLLLAHLNSLSRYLIVL